MIPDSKNKETSFLSKTVKKFWTWVEAVFESFKFKPTDLWWHKLLKILLRVVSILILIALSPLILVTTLLIILLAS